MGVSAWGDQRTYGIRIRIMHKMMQFAVAHTTYLWNNVGIYLVAGNTFFRLALRLSAQCLRPVSMRISQQSTLPVPETPKSHTDSRRIVSRWVSTSIHLRSTTRPASCLCPRRDRESLELNIQGDSLPRCPKMTLQFAASLPGQFITMKPTNQ